MGVLYAEGIGVKQDQSQALEWHRLAAISGHATVQYRLGKIYANGEGVIQNKAEAVKWHQRTADFDNEYDRVSLGLSHI